MFFFFKYDTFKQYDVFYMKTDEMVSFLFYFILLSLTESLVYPTADHAPIFSNREYRSMHDHTLQWRPSAVRGLPTILERQNCGTVIYCVIVYALRRYQFTIQKKTFVRTLKNLCTEKKYISFQKIVIKTLWCLFSFDLVFAEILFHNIVI